MSRSVPVLVVRVNSGELTNSSTVALLSHTSGIAEDGTGFPVLYSPIFITRFYNSGIAGQSTILADVTESLFKATL